MTWIWACLLGLAALIGAFLYWKLRYFLRDPPRRIPPGEQHIVAAADGFITYVKRVEAGEIPIAIKQRRRIALTELTALDPAPTSAGYLIGTYMTERSVHRNRSPVGGEIVLREHRSAAPFNRSMARMTANLVLGRRPYETDCEYLLANERLTIGIRAAGGATVTVTQIADVWVSRIVARVSVGDRLARGQQYGMIRLGSQCDVFLPDELVERVLVEPGQYVWAGESVLALARLRLDDASLQEGGADQTTRGRKPSRQAPRNASHMSVGGCA